MWEDRHDVERTPADREQLDPSPPLLPGLCEPLGPGPGAKVSRARRFVRTLGRIIFG